jgi:hypothetical protein
MQIARLTDLCAESLAYGFDDFYGALAKYKNFLPEDVLARKDKLAQAFLRKSVELHLQRAFVTYWQRRFVARASGESVYGPDIRYPHADSDGRNARSECALSSEVFHADATHMIILCMSAHGYHGIRPRIRRARITPRNCKTFGWPAVRKRTYMSYTMLQTASTVHMGPGAPTCHVRHVHLTPNCHPFSLTDHARSNLGRTPTVCNM